MCSTMIHPRFARSELASRWWLHHSLHQLQRDLAALGGSLILRRGAASDVLPAVVAEVGATSVHWNRRYGSARAIDTELKVSLPDAHSYTGSLLHDPWSVTTGAGTPFKVFTPFWKSILAETQPRQPLVAPASITGAEAASDVLDSWNLLPRSAVGRTNSPVSGHRVKPELAASDSSDFLADGLRALSPS